MKISLLLAMALASVLASKQAWALHPAEPAEDVFFQNVMYFESESFEKNESVVGVCSATLISNQYAVTAAHCLSDAAIAQKFVIHIQLGKYKYVKRHSDGQEVRVGYVRYFDQRVPADFLFLKSVEPKLNRKYLNSISPNEDVALIKFQTPLVLDAGFVFAQILDRQDFEKLKTSIAPHTLGAVSINYVAEVSNTDPKRIALFDKVNWHKGLGGSGWFISESTSRVDAGDSGAPIFAVKDKTYYLVGVVKGQAKTVISNWDVFAPVVENLCQLNQEHHLNNAALFCK